MKSVVRFLSEVRAELALIEWPKFEEFTGSTMVVLVIVALFAVFLLAVDQGIAWNANKIFAYSV